MDVKLAIVGSRNFTSYAFLNDNINRLIKENNWNVTHVVSGGAKGADSLAELWAKLHKVPTIIHPADWDTYGKQAGYIRNKLIVADADVVVAFWDLKSPGTKHSIDLAAEMKKSLTIINTNILGKKN